MYHSFFPKSLSEVPVQPQPLPPFPVSAASAFLQCISPAADRRAQRRTILDAYPGILSGLSAPYRATIAQGKRERPEDAIMGYPSARATVVSESTSSDGEEPSTEGGIVAGFNKSKKSTSGSFTPAATLPPVDSQRRSFLQLPASLVGTSPAPGAARLPRRTAFTNPAAHEAGINHMGWSSPHGHVLFTADVGGCVRAWSLANGSAMRQPLATYQSHPGPLRAMRVTGEDLITASEGVVRLWDASRGVVTRDLTHKDGSVSCTDVLVHPKNNSVIIASFGREIVIFDARVGGASQVQAIYTDHSSVILSLCFLDADGHYFASTAADKSLFTWPYGSLTNALTHFADTHVQTMPYLVRHPREDYLAAQSVDNSIRIFSISRDGRVRLVRERLFNGHVVAGRSCRQAFSPDGLYLSSGDATGKVFIWDWKSGELKKSFEAHSKPCVVHSWHPADSKKLVTTGMDCAIKVWL